MARLPIVGGDSENWGTILNEFLRVSHQENGLLKSTVKVFNVKDYGAVGNGTVDDTMLSETQSMPPRTLIVGVRFTSRPAIILLPALFPLPRRKPLR